MGDSFMSETFSQEFVTTYKRAFFFFSPPFFFPINVKQTRGVRACGCDGEMGAGFFFAPVPWKKLFGARSPPPKPGIGGETAS